MRSRIESGEYAPGMRLPSINDQIQTYGVAHLTANKALRLLVTEGLAELSPAWVSASRLASALTWPYATLQGSLTTDTPSKRNSSSTHQLRTCAVRGWITSRTLSRWTGTNSARCWSPPGSALRLSMR